VRRLDRKLNGWGRHVDTRGRAVLTRALREHGFRLKEIADALEVTRQTVHADLTRGQR
jgi:hypothetical protein